MDTRTITTTLAGKSIPITSHSEEETFEIAQTVADSLQGGDVLALSGELGAGKTAFVKGLAEALGVSHTITSPTFVVMKVYDVPAHETITTL
ncbi:MAG: tRNA (adenosine(37)-N6)-threonylcarbamoyltransferase complex ATPase subunit type 1 TsaE, partial [Patescibacteria group bacterium]